MVRLLQHQEIARQWLGDNPRSCLAWQMGTGKTYAALAAYEKHVFPKPLLIVCLASAKEMWARAVLEICPTAHVSVIGRTSCRSNPVHDAQVVITNYERLQDWRYQRPWGAVIFDEAHRLKNRHAKCTQAAYGTNGIAGLATYVWLLSGTIMPNHPGELYTHCAELWPEKFSKPNGRVVGYRAFEERYCVTRPTDWGTQVLAAKNLDDLHERIDRYVWRLRTTDVLDLPRLTIGTWPIAAGKCGDAAALAELRERYELDSESGIDDLLSAVNSNEALAKVRRDTASIKAAAGLEMLLQEDHKGKTLVFAHHRDAIDILQKGLNAVTIHGGTPVAHRQDLVDTFQNDPNVHYFVGQITAAGASLNLQAADNVVFVESSWVPAENEQAIARAYRNGQTKPVNVRFLYLQGSVDEIVNEVLARKAGMAFHA